jgi:hypothetical protein
MVSTGNPEGNPGYDSSDSDTYALLRCQRSVLYNDDLGRASSYLREHCLQYIFSHAFRLGVILKMFWIHFSNCLGLIYARL